MEFVRAVAKLTSITTLTKSASIALVEKVAESGGILLPSSTTNGCVR